MWIGTIGVLMACFGCGLITQNQFNAANAFLILSWLILVPLFGYLLRTRRRLKRVVRRQDEQRQQELDALGSVGSMQSITSQQEKPET